MTALKTPTDPSWPGQREFSRNGFSLVEVVIVIGVIALLSVIAYPSLNKWMPNYELKAAARELHGQLQRAKLHAVKINDDVLLTVTEPDSYFMVEKISGTRVISGTVREGIGLASNVNDGVSGFSPWGLPANNNGFTITLTHDKAAGREHKITQSLSGSIRIE